MSYRLDVKYRYGMSTANEVLIADGTSESAAKEALVRKKGSFFSNATILDVKVL